MQIDQQNSLKILKRKIIKKLKTVALLSNLSLEKDFFVGMLLMR